MKQCFRPACEASKSPFEDRGDGSCLREASHHDLTVHLFQVRLPKGVARRAGGCRPPRHSPGGPFPRSQVALRDAGSWPRALKKGKAGNAGMTLLECLCVLAVMTILVSVLSQTFISTTRLSASANTALDRVRQAAEIRDGFTAAVHEAGRVADGILEYKTGGDCLVLELSPAPDTAARRYAVLRRLDTGTFARLDLEQRDGACTVTFFKTYALWTQALRFSATKDSRMVSMEMDLQNAAQSPNRPPVVYAFSATMRSILRGEGRA